MRVGTGIFIHRHIPFRPWGKTVECKGLAKDHGLPPVDKIPLTLDRITEKQSGRIRITGVTVRIFPGQIRIEIRVVDRLTMVGIIDLTRIWRREDRPLLNSL